MVIHSGTLFGGLHYFVVSQTFISTSMQRDGRVRSPSPPASPRQPAFSLLASPEAKRHHPPPSRRKEGKLGATEHPPDLAVEWIHVKLVGAGKGVGTMGALLHNARTARLLLGEMGVFCYYG